MDFEHSERARDYMAPLERSVRERVAPNDQSMRAIGGAERALQRLCERAVGRVAFGKPLANLGGNRDVIANCRMAIAQARLLTLDAAWALARTARSARPRTLRRSK